MVVILRTYRLCDRIRYKEQQPMKTSVCTEINQWMLKGCLSSIMKRLTRFSLQTIVFSPPGWMDGLKVNTTLVPSEEVLRLLMGPWMQRHQM